MTQLHQKLAKTEANHLRRLLQPRQATDGVVITHQGQRLIHFCSNDYLGMSQHPAVKEAAIAAIQQYGLGSGAAQTIGGYTEAHAELEAALAAFLSVPAVRLFSTGYMANAGMVNTLVQRHDLCFADRQNHASLIDAVSQTHSKCYRYRHLEHTHLEDLLRQHPTSNTKRWIISDTVFSMSGDCIGLNDLTHLAEQHQAHLLLDDAHGLGVIGKDGRGLIGQIQWPQTTIPAATITFGKALGSFGACVVGHETVVAAITQYARTFLFTTAMPPAIACATRAALQCLQQEPEHRDRLQSNMAYFKTCAQQLGVAHAPSQSAIFALPMADVQTACDTMQHLLNHGFYVQAIRPPTVQKPCLRITLHANHTHAMIDALLETYVAQQSRH